MAMNPEDVVTLIKAGLPGADVMVEDLVGDREHLRATVVYDGFKGKSRIEQHKMVYATLGERVGGIIHALSVVTKVS